LPLYFGLAKERGIKENNDFLCSGDYSLVLSGAYPDKLLVGKLTKEN
jgi:hypothetical protein